LNRDGAYYEADRLIDLDMVWVHTLATRGVPESERIVSIVAYTRTSEKVATITKVIGFAILSE